MARGTTYLLGLPQIESLADLSLHLHMTPGLLWRLSRHPELFYKRIEVPKRSGGYRVVYGPARPLKAVQAWVLRHILERFSPHNAATAYKRGTNLLDNAKVHRGRKFFLCIDLECFFDSIPESKVFSLFRSMGYNPHVSSLLSSLCTLEGRVPQGAVTSPYISNLIAIRLDRRITGYVGLRHVAYSRYADDITLSSNDPAVLYRCQRMIERIVEDEGFTVNKSKLRRLGPRKRRVITGLVMSDDGVPRIGRRRKRLLRAEIHHRDVKGIPPAQRSRIDQYIAGWMGHLRAVDGDAYQQLVRYRERLSIRVTGAQAAPAAQSRAGARKDQKPVFLVEAGMITARGVIVDSGFLVLKGSSASPTVMPSLSESRREMRKKLIAEGVLAQSSQGLLSFTQDVLFGSSSAALSVILGYAVSGPLTWKTLQGEYLAEIEKGSP